MLKNPELFERHRKELMRSMNGGVAVIPTSPVRSRNNDVDYAYRPDSDFYYMTGFCEPEAVAVLCPGRKGGEFLIFCRENDLEKEIWHGRRAGLEGVVEHYGADDAFPIADIGDILPSLLEDKEKIFYNVGRYPEFDQQIMTWLNDIKQRSRTGVVAPYELIDLGHFLHEQRLIKRKEEIAIMRKAAKISARGHMRAMKSCRPGMTEQQVQAELEYEFRRLGTTDNAYPSIVAGGENACILHYTENNAVLNDGDLLMIDAGAELDCYASDISRTFPVNGRFSDEQKQLYQVVLDAQEAAFTVCEAGQHWNRPHEKAVEVLTQGLVDLKILQGNVADLVESQAYRPFYMHRTGHWLGLDVHDVGDYQIGHEWRALEAGMVFTVEPGLYIGENPDVDPKWHNIGIRIEDDVVIKKTGYEILTADVPKSIVDIEALMAS